MTAVRRQLSLAAMLLCATSALVGCGSADDSDEVAADPPATPSATVGGVEPSPSTQTTGSPSAIPSVPSGTGRYPAYPVQDYDFTLVVGCFCAGAGTPILVMVRDGAVREATYQGDGRGAETGADATDLAATVQQIIARANAGPAERVTVVQPQGQDWPTSVTIAGKPGLADDGIGWTISEVRPVTDGVQSGG